MSVKHTPPWHRMGEGRFGKNTGTYIEQEGFGIIGAWINIEGSSYSLDLIEAAPAMLRRLKLISQRWEMEPDNAVFPAAAMRREVLQLIAQAEGGAR